MQKHDEPFRIYLSQDGIEYLGHLQRVYADIKRQHVQEGFEEGFEQGFEQGLKQRFVQGRRQGLLTSIEALCEVLGIELANGRREHLDSQDIAGLETVLAALRTTRRWPEP